MTQRINGEKLFKFGRKHKPTDSVWEKIPNKIIQRNLCQNILKLLKMKALREMTSYLQQEQAIQRKVYCSLETIDAGRKWHLIFQVLKETTVNSESYIKQNNL